MQNIKNMKQLILNTKEPLLIKNQMQCELTCWSLPQWNEAFGDELLQFRCGKHQHTEQPQWESTCLTKSANFEDFLKNSHSEIDEWWYFDYKYLSQWFTDKNALKQKIDWSALGFPEIKSDDSTIWIGSKGAHTPCHIDTYGCNLVLQVFGRKQWLLFPPEQNLKPTRIPFEESSIYSKLNFFSPNAADFKGVNHCHKVVLNPGEVLVVPNRWWHYVENIETAISINAWLPVPQDEYERVKESIATIFVRQVTQIQSECQDIILNPNMLEEMVSSDAALSIIEMYKEKCKPKSNKIRKTIEGNTGETNIEELLDQFKNVSKIPILSEAEWSHFLTKQSARFDKPRLNNSVSKTAECKRIVDFLEVITDQEVLDLIAKKLLKKN